MHFKVTTTNALAIATVINIPLTKGTTKQSMKHTINSGSFDMKNSCASPNPNYEAIPNWCKAHTQTTAHT